MGNDEFAHQWAVYVVVSLCVSAALIAISTILYANVRNSRDNDTRVKTARIEACRTVVEESMRTLCVIEGGLRGR